MATLSPGSYWIDVAGHAGIYTFDVWLDANAASVRVVSTEYQADGVPSDLGDLDKVRARVLFEVTKPVASPKGAGLGTPSPSQVEIGPAQIHEEPRNLLADAAEGAMAETSRSIKQWSRTYGLLILFGGLVYHLSKKRR